MTPSRKSDRRPYGAPPLEEILVWQFTLIWLCQFLPEDAGERLAAGENPDRIVEEMGGRLLGHVGKLLLEAQR